MDNIDHQSILDGIPSNTIILDETGQILLANKAWRDFAHTNGSDDDFVGANYLQVCDAVPPESPDAPTAQAFAAGIREVINQKYDVFELEYPFPAPDRMYWFRGQVSRLSLDGPVRLMVSHEDITRRKLAERDLYIKQWAIESAIDAIMLADVGGYLTYANPALVHMWGYPSAAALLDQPITCLWESESEALDILAHIRMTGEWRGEIIARHTDGTQFHAQMAASIITEGDQPLHIIASFADTTEQRRAETNRREAAVLQVELEHERTVRDMKTRFLSLLSHDFRTPMTVILSSTGLLRRYGDQLTPEKLARHLDKIDAQVNRMERMMTDIAFINRPDAGQHPFLPAPIILSDYLKQIIDEVQIAYPSTVPVSLTITQPEIVADELLLQKILVNLLSNAVKFTPDGGQIDIICTTHDNMNTIQVCDTGIGIPQDNQRDVFQLFYRASNVGRIPGTGLGLAIARRAADAHGGSITFHSELNVGTTFTVRLPAHGTVHADFPAESHPESHSPPH
jgi:PAS domain S-box-containing protein